MRVLVTGGCGFIGSHLVDALVARGDEVVVLDDLSTGKQENIPGTVKFLNGDVIDDETVTEAIKGVNACFHLAAIASVPLCRELWYRAHRVNQSGIVNIFDKAHKEAERTGAPIPVIYASSAAVYGDKAPAPVPEAYRGVPLSSYGLDKYGCELQAALASLAYGIPTCGLRFFNVYGPRQVSDSPYSGVISAFLPRAIAKSPLVIHGDGLQVRDFIFVSDVVNALMEGLKKAAEGALVANVCTGQGTSILELADKINAICGNSSPIRFEAARKDDIRCSIGDPSLARQKLSFMANTDLRRGLEQTLASFVKADVSPAF